MSELCTYLPTGGWPRFACDVLWQSTLVGLIAWGVLRPLVRRPALRAWILLLALVCCVATPVGSAGLRSGGYGLIARADLSAAEEIVQPQVLPTKAPIVLASSDRKDASVATFVGGGAPLGASAEKTVSWWTVMGVPWAAASTALALRLLLSLIGLWRLGRTATACADRQIVATAAEAARRVGSCKAPPVSVSPWVSSPTVLAFGRPRLFIPPSGGQPLDESDWLSVFCHELAHARRGDGWGRLLSELAVILLPWQPFTWLLRRAYHQACDEACDDWAVAAGADPVELASTLTAWIPRKTPALALGVVSFSGVRPRILRLLSLCEPLGPRMGIGWGLASTTVVLLLAASVAAAQVRQPKARKKARSARSQSEVRLGNKRQADRQEALKRTGLKPYRIEPPDVLQIEAFKLVPLPPYRAQVYDVLQVQVIGTLPDHPIGPTDSYGRNTPDGGYYLVEAEGTVNLGPAYGTVRVAGMTIRQIKKATRRHLRPVLKRPKVSVQLARASGTQPVTGPYLVGPDGTVNLRQYGAVHVSGKTIVEAKRALQEHLAQYFVSPKVSVDVAAYNSKVYYVVIVRAKLGDHVIRIPIRGKETVLDAISQVGGPSKLSGKKIWISRPATDGSDRHETIPVDLDAIRRGGPSDTDYRLLPGDRVFITGGEITLPLGLGRLLPYGTLLQRVAPQDPEPAPKLPPPVAR